jgi:hypothetical protein
LVANQILTKIASKSPLPEDESSLKADLERRWESALEGLRHAELEMSLGNVSESDYLWLKEVHMTEAALVLKTLEISDKEKGFLIKQIPSDSGYEEE